jgi:hypothetical protein
MKRCFASENEVYIPLNASCHKSRFKSDLGSSYIPLVTACFEWRKVQGLHILNKSRVKAALEDENFQKICEIHETMKERGRGYCVPRVLLEMVDRYLMEYLVAYAYLENSIPKEYERYNLLFLGRASELPSLLTSLDLVYKPSKS